MLFYVLSFLAGFLVKAVDWLDDERKSKNAIKYLLAIIYGLTIGYLISTAPFSALFLGALVAQLFARKIDTPAHMLGGAISLISLFFFGFPQIALASFALFFVLAYIDELNFPKLFEQHPSVQKLIEVSKTSRQFEWITKWRVLLKLGGAIFLIFGRWDYLLAILLFDGGYLLFDILSAKFQ